MFLQNLANSVTYRTNVVETCRFMRAIIAPIILNSNYMFRKIRRALCFLK